MDYFHRNVDGVFEEVASSVIFHPASGIDAPAVAQAQATLRRRIGSL